MSSDGGSGVYVQWEKGASRYHVWINERKGKAELIETLFKNPLEGIERGKPGHFDTRRLQPFNDANRRDVEYALKVADIERAKSEYIFKEKREQDQREQDRKDRVAREKLNAAAPRLLATLREILACCSAYGADIEHDDSISTDWVADKCQTAIADL